MPPSASMVGMNTTPSFQGSATANGLAAGAGAAGLAAGAPRSGLSPGASALSGNASAPSSGTSELSDDQCVVPRPSGSAGTPPSSDAPALDAFRNVTPFSYRYCACQQAAIDGRDLMQSLARSTRSAAASLADTVTHCSAIDWTGNASNLYREQLRQCGRTAPAVAERADTAARLTLTGGTP